MNNPALGCIPEEPHAGSFMYEAIAGGNELPDTFLIESVPTHYQNGQPCCTSSATSSAKGSREGKKLSPRALWVMVKKDDGVVGGAYITTNLKKLIEYGIPEYGAISEDVHVPLEEYMNAVLSPNVLYKSKEHKSQSYWWIYKEDKDLQYVALVNENIPLILAMPWYKDYYGVNNGFLPEPKTFSGYHAVILKGRAKDENGYYRVYQNSHDPKEDKTDFYIYEKDLDRYELGTHFVLVDIGKDDAKTVMAETYDSDDPKIELRRENEVRYVPDVFVPYLTGKIISERTGEYIKYPYSIA